MSDLAVEVEGDPERPTLPWITTRSLLRPESGDGFAFAVPFTVEGRSTVSVIAEFGDDLGWSPEPGSRSRLRLKGAVYPGGGWTSIGSFDWWAPPPGSEVGSYITYRNEPSPT